LAIEHHLQHDQGVGLIVFEAIQIKEMHRSSFMHGFFRQRAVR